MKRILAIILATAMVFGCLAGCSSKDKGGRPSAAIDAGAGNLVKPTETPTEEPTEHIDPVRGVDAYIDGIPAGYKEVRSVSDAVFSMPAEYDEESLTFADLFTGMLILTFAGLTDDTEDMDTAALDDIARMLDYPVKVWAANSFMIMDFGFGSAIMNEEAMEEDFVLDGSMFAVCSMANDEGLDAMSLTGDEVAELMGESFVSGLNELSALAGSEDTTESTLTGSVDSGSIVRLAYTDGKVIYKVEYIDEDTNAAYDAYCAIVTDANTVVVASVIFSGECDYALNFVRSVAIDHSVVGHDPTEEEMMGALLQYINDTYPELLEDDEGGADDFDWDLTDPDWEFLPND